MMMRMMMMEMEMERSVGGFVYGHKERGAQEVGEVIGCVCG
jgi:hypothetical protein